MAGNTLFIVSNPVNPQDVVTKDYVDKRFNAGFLEEKGGYNVKGYLNTGFNETKNVKDPTEIHEVATKNYVDSFGKAIVQQLDGTSSAIADIDMRGYTLTNVIDPAVTRRCD